MEKFTDFQLLNYVYSFLNSSGSDVFVKEAGSFYIHENRLSFYTELWFKRDNTDYLLLELDKGAKFNIEAFKEKFMQSLKKTFPEEFI